MGNFRIIEPDYTNIEKAFKDLKSGFKNEYSQNLKATLFKDTFRLEVKVANFVDEDECIGFVEGYGFQYLHKTGNSIWFEYPKGQVADSKRIKDANDTPDVLDGILMIAFNDGEEEDGYNEVKSHANEQGEIDGVKYETYDTDTQDGVTLIDLCALTDDANAFVKALLEEWGVIDSVADIEFEASENMKEEVSDSRRVKDEGVSAEYKDKVYWQKGKWSIRKTNYGLAVSDGWYTDLITIYDYETPRVGYEMNIAPDFVKRKVLELVKKGVLVNREDELSDSRRVSDMIKPAHLRGYAINQRKKRRGGENPDKLSRVEGDVLDENMDSNGIYDSYRVSDMTKPAHLRGYAERYRQKRRAKQGQVSREEKVDEDDTTDKGNIADSRDARFFVYKNRQDVTPDKEGFVKKSDAIAFAKTMVDDNDRTMVEVYRYDENDEWGNVEQTVWTSNSQPKTDLEYWGVRETTIKKLKPNEWFTLKPIPEPSASQVWTKLFYNREDRTYTCSRYDGGSERYFKGDRKVYTDFIF